MSRVLSFLPLTPAGHAYLALVLGITAGTFGLPVPEEVPLLTAGVLAALGVIDLGHVILLGIVACFTGDVIVYTIGRRIGSGLTTNRRFNRVLRSRHLLRARREYKRHGGWTLVIARLLPGLKMPFLVTAGVMRMPWRRFVAYDLLSVFALVPTLVLLGYHSAANVSRLRGLVHDIGIAGTLAFVSLAIAGVAGAWLLRQRRHAVDAPAELIQTSPEQWQHDQASRDERAASGR